MTDREKMLEILRQISGNCLPCVTGDLHLELLATALIANGVTVKKRISAIVPVTTNADRIRVMSDEELACLLTDFSNNAGWVTETGREICYECNMAWLKQPVKEDE